MFQDGEADQANVQVRKRINYRHMYLTMDLVEVVQTAQATSKLDHSKTNPMQRLSTG
jgi:hypothetical protein